MLTPLQQSSGIAAMSLMRSMVEAMEERERQEQEKASGFKRDDNTLARARLEYDPAQKLANEKINSFLFSLFNRDEDPFATLVSRFAAALGAVQEADESNAAFARRLKDALILTEAFAKSDSLGKPTRISLQSLGVTQDEVTAVMAGTTAPDTKPMAQLAARYAAAAGLTGKEEDFSTQLSNILTDTRARLPKDKTELEEATGLKALGIGAEQMIAAIANPFGEEARFVKAALEKQAADKKAVTMETLKVIQRLEGIADPKSKAELLAERNEEKIGKINDAEVKAERERQIKALESGEKLEDAKKQQEALKDRLEAAAQQEKAGAAATPDARDAIAAIHILAALASGAATQTAAGSQDGDRVAKAERSPQKAAEPSGQENDTEKAEDWTKAPAMQREARQNEIFPLRIDDNGLYEWLRKKAA